MYSGRGINIVDFVYDDSKIYFMALDMPFIWQYDCLKRKIQVLIKFPAELNIRGAFVRLIKVKQKIYCIPCFADNIYCLNLENRLFYSLKISEELFYHMPARKIIEPVNCGDRIFFVCRSPHLIIEINTEKDTFEIYKPENIKQEHNFFSVKIVNGVIQYPFLQNQLICFDIEIKKFYIKKLYESIIEICPEEKYIYNFDYDRMGSIWWCNFDGEVYRNINKMTEKIRMPESFIGKYHDIIDRERPGINGMVFIDNKLCFILATDYRILQYDIYKKEFIWSENSGEESFKNQEIYFHYNILNDKGLVLFSQVTNSFYFWNIEKGFELKVAMRISPEILAENSILLEYYNFENETEYIDLQFYLEYLKKEKKKKIGEIENNVGEKIYCINLL